MIDILKRVEKEQMLNLLQQRSIWQTVDVDYHPPRVERVWCPVELDGEEYRLYLHYIHPCTTEEALYHSHPWASAVHVLSGTYEMGLGAEKKHQHEDEPVVIETYATVECYGGMYYQMLNPYGYHYVRPVDDICKTIMLTAKPWSKIQNNTPKPTKTLEKLSDGMKNNILDWYEVYYNFK